MPKEDDEIIELTEIVEDEGSDEDDFMKELSGDSLFDDSEESSDELEGDDEVSAFFSSGGAELTDPAVGVEEPLFEGATAPKEEPEEDFDSFLVDLEEDIQLEQNASRPHETEPQELTPLADPEELAPIEPEELAPLEPEEEPLIEEEEPVEAEDESESFLSQGDIDDLEKQWSQALDSPEDVSVEEAEPEEVLDAIEPEATATALGVAAGLSAAEPPVGAEASSVSQAPPVIDQEDLERALEKVVREILEPIAERVFAEVAQQLISREIDRLKTDIADLEEDQ